MQSANRITPTPNPTAPKILDLPLAKLRTDGGTLLHASGLDHALAAAYAEDLDNGAQFPPVTAFQDAEGAYWLASGHHRHAAHVLRKRKTILAQIRPGSVRDAILFAAGENAEHGARRTTADKEAAVTALLEDEEWGQWSNMEIARRCRVSDWLVREVRRRIFVPHEDSSRKVQRGDKTYRMKTKEIGLKSGRGVRFRDLPPEEQFRQATEAETQAAKERAAADRLQAIEAAQKRWNWGIAFLTEAGISGKSVAKAIAWVRRGIAELERMKE
jgi:hypothetical protein